MKNDKIKTIQPWGEDQATDDALHRESEAERVWDERQKRKSETAEGAVNSVLHGTIDPTVNLEGKPIPAMTTMLYRVCDNDPGKFEEATRIVKLFIAETLKMSTREPHTSNIDPPPAA